MNQCQWDLLKNCFWFIANITPYQHEITLDILQRTKVIEAMKHAAVVLPTLIGTNAFLACNLVCTIQVSITMQDKIGICQLIAGPALKQLEDIIL